MVFPILSVIAAGFLVVNGFCSAEWPNEPAGSQLIVDCPFSGSICPPFTDTYRNARFGSDPTGPLSPSGVLDDMLAPGATQGGAQIRFSLPNVRRLYIGAWWKTNSAFQGLNNSSNKLFLQRGLGNSDVWEWYGGQDQPKTFMMAFSNNQNNCHVSGYRGDCPAPGQGGGGLLSPNRGNGTVAAGSGWHRLETFSQSSTTATSRDGIIRWWLDGNLIGDYTNLNYMPDGFNEFAMTHTWDGSGSLQCSARDCSREWHHYWDHMRISVPGEAPSLKLVITSPLPTSAQVGKSYSSTLAAQYGTPPYSWTVSAGSLPPGLSLNKSTGVLSGTPTTVGRSDFTVKVTDSNAPAAEATKAFTIIVSQSSGIAGVGLTINSLQLTATPGKTSVSFQMPQTGNHMLSVYDLSGHEVWRNGGSVEAVWNHGGKLKKGIYLVRVEQNGKTMSTNYCHVW